MNPDTRLVEIKPSERQLAYMRNGFNCFIHYSMNTYTGREWGLGDELPEQFCPEEVDTDEWVRTAKAAGMNGIILTCKHHDGFCLWPSKYTEHSIKNSPYKEGRGDIVGELSASCKKYGMKFGVYLSPWDRNSKFYGKGKAYDDYYIAQLTELLTEYGEIFAVWLDGACGESEDGKYQAYDWNRYFEVVRRLQPNAVISISGPDIRWCGNEAGQARSDEWSVVSAGLSDPGLTAKLSQQNDDESFRQRPIDATMEDLGSRKALEGEEALIYYPSEMDVSIRPGWFYHASEDNEVRSVDDLFDIYLKSVGHNSTLLLNVPVMPDGHMNTVDIEQMEQLGKRIEEAFSENKVDSASIVIENGRKNPDQLIVGDGPSMSVELIWEKEIQIRYISIKEDIAYSQRVERFHIAFLDKDGNMKAVTRGTTIGHQEIIQTDVSEVKKIVITIEDSRVAPYIKEIAVY